MPETIVTTDTLIAEMREVQVVYSGIVAAFNVTTFAGTSLEISAAHNNMLVRCTSAIGATAILPADETTELPVGFACTLVLDAETADVLEVVSEDMTGDYGTPARRATHYSDGAPTPSTFAPAFMPITCLKISANRWLITGHYVP